MVHLIFPGVVRAFGRSEHPAAVRVKIFHTYFTRDGYNREFTNSLSNTNTPNTHLWNRRRVPYHGIVVSPGPSANGAIQIPKLDWETC